MYQIEPPPKSDRKPHPTQVDGDPYQLECMYPPFICHLTLSCDEMNTPLFNHVCVTVCLSTPLLKCPFEKGLCSVPWGGWFQNDLSITGKVPALRQGRKGAGGEARAVRGRERACAVDRG